jgi:hypothetical protein
LRRAILIEYGDGIKRDLEAEFVASDDFREKREVGE